MNILLEPHKQLLKRLIEFKIDFILIGGYAVNFHGYNRVTGDMDVWLKPTDENRDKQITVLEAQGILAEDLDQNRKTDFTQTRAFHIDDLLAEQIF